MAKQAAPKQSKSGDNSDRKNGKAWKKNDGMARQTASVTGRTVKGYKISRVSEWSDVEDPSSVLSNTKFFAVFGRAK